MNSLKRICCALLCLCCCTSVMAQDNVTKLRTAILSNYAFTSNYVIKPTQAPMSKIMTRIGADGSFNRSNKTPKIEDLTDTLFKMVYVFNRPDSTAYYQNATVKDKLYRGVNYWLNQYPSFTWTSSAFAQPKSLGMILMKLYNNMQTDATDPTYGPILANIKQKAQAFVRNSWSSGASKTTFNNPNLGTDLTDQWHRTANVGYRIFGYATIFAALNDSLAVDTLSTIMANQFPLQINKPGNYLLAVNLFDGSIFAHSAQTFNVGYGTDWLTDLAYFGAWTKNTKWKYSRAQIDLFGNLINDGMRWMAYKKRTFHNIIGRHNQVTGASVYDQKNPIGNFLAMADATYPQYATLTALKDSLTNNNNYVLDSTKYLWNSHLIIQNSPKYGASIKMLSSRIVGTETSDATSGMGLMNFYVADGSTLIYRRIDEYDNARVGWNWRCVPGITAKQKTGSLPLVPWSDGYESNNTIAGGVSDGDVSIGAFKLDRTNSYAKTKAMKAYFSFKDALICVGNSVSDTDAASGDVYTTINQTQRRTDTYYKINADPEQTVALGTNLATNLSVTSPSWFWQDSIGYVILPKSSIATSVVLRAETRTGNWYNLDKRNANTSVSVNIFQLSINHGIAGSGKDDSYRYVVLPSVSKTELINFFNSKILGADSTSLYVNYNAPNLISVSYAGYTGVFFNSTSSLKASNLGADNLSLSSDKPAVVLLKRKSNGMDVNVSDFKNGFYTNNEISLGINKIFKEKTFTPLRANGPVTITATLDSSIVKVNTSKVSDIYEGEPVQVKMINGFPTIKTDSVTVIADAFVQDGTYANTNYGANSYLAITNGSTNYKREAYLKFDLHGMKGNVLTGKLRMYTSSAAATQWDLHNVSNDSWTETGINWNNKPSADAAVLASVPGATASGYVYWDIANSLKTLGADSILSLKIDVPSSIGYVYSSLSSKESSYAPKIIFSTDTVISTLTVKTAPVIADAFVKDGTFTNNNFGSATYLEVKKDGPSYKREAYVKFDLHGAGGKITSAKLKLYSLAASTSKWQLEKVNDNSWVEGTIKWSSAPVADSLINVQDGTTAAGWVAFDVTNQLQHLAADSLLSVKVSALTSSIFTSFSSKEGAAEWKPYIEYTVETTDTLGGMQAPLFMATGSPQEVVVPQKSIEKKMDDELVVQNILTPNGDGKNDRWLIKNIENYPKNMVKMITPQGKLVFSKANYQNDWDGYYNGAPLPEGPYFFIIQTSPNTKPIKGTLVVLQNR